MRMDGRMESHVLRRRCPTCATPVILASRALRVTRWAPPRRTAHARCEALTSVTCLTHHSPANRSLATPLLPTAQSPLFTAQRGIRKPGRDPTGARRLAHCAFLLPARTSLLGPAARPPAHIPPRLRPLAAASRLLPPTAQTPPVGGDPSPRRRSTLAPFRVGAGPTGPGCQMPGARGIVPLAVLAAPLHIPWGRHYWAKLQLALRSAAHYSAALALRPSRGSSRGHVWHVLLRIGPIPCRRPYRSYGPGPPAPASESALGRGPASGRTGGIPVYPVRFRLTRQPG